MESYASINGVRVPILTELRPNKIRGLMSGSILVISYNCEIPIKVKEYLDLRKIKIVRLD